jgi:hypothetical protein
MTDDPMRTTFHRAAQPGPSSTKGEPLERLIGVVGTLGDRNLDVLEELQAGTRAVRRTNRLVVAGIGVGGLLTGAFLFGAYMIHEGKRELAEAREVDRAKLAADIAKAKTELEKSVRRAEAAADRAAAQAQQAVAESVEAQVEAAEVRVKLAAPRERRAVQRQIESRKATAKELRRKAHAK